MFSCQDLTSKKMEKAPQVFDSYLFTVETTGWITQGTTVLWTGVAPDPGCLTIGGIPSGMPPFASSLSYIARTSGGSSSCSMMWPPSRSLVVESQIVPRIDKKKHQEQKHQQPDDAREFRRPRHTSSVRFECFI